MFTYLTVSVLSVNIGDSVCASNSVGSSLNTQDFSIKDSLGRVRLKMGLSCSPWTIPLSKCALAIFYCGLTMKNVYISMSLLRMCSAEINWPILRILLYLAHALNTPEGDLCEKENRGHFITLRATGCPVITKLAKTKATWGFSIFRMDKLSMPSRPLGFVTETLT